MTAATPGVSARPGSIEVGGHTTRWIEAGPATSAVVFLLVHGFSDSADTWRPLMRELAGMGIRSVAIDLPSHARATTLRRDEGALSQCVRTMSDAIDLLDGDVVLVGNSLGGAVALLTAQQRPDLRAVVGIGPAAVAHPLWLRVVLHPASQRLARRVPAPLLVGPYAMTGLLAGMTWPGLRSYLGHVRRASNQHRLQRLAIRLATEALAPFDPASIEPPVVFIWGDRDRFSSIGGAHGFLDEVADGRLIRLVGGGHVPHQSRPRTVAHLLRYAADIGPDLT